MEKLVKVLAWLLMDGHVNTREFMLRKNQHLDLGTE
jgi:hypothetical protein